MNENDHEAKKEGTIPNKGSLQAYLQNFTKEAIDAIVDILRNSRNENLKMGAAKLIIDKSIADLKAVELTGKDGEPIKLNVIAGADYFAWREKVAAASAESVIPITSEVQGSSVAQESTQDINGNSTIGKLESA